jgi:hypothetical protein
MPTREELLTLTEVVEQYGHARSWWYDQAKAGRLTFYKLPGDRNTYLSQAEVLAALEIRPKTRTDESGNKDAV